MFSIGLSTAPGIRAFCLVQVGAPFVFSFAGASLTLAATVAGNSPALNDLRLNHVPQPALALGRLT